MMIDVFNDNLNIEVHTINLGHKKENAFVITRALVENIRH